ncbi:hypothetical protein HID58_064371 [Brassica napus]|uniref:BHLH domain-containing protein n=1 Tax=Brassica napus TaxID=3708 RepID=A0ABQ7Z9S6_BRANA|nr:hypothetical protein HID58_064371 [Brassica napus]
MVDSLFPSIETTVDDASPESRQKRRRLSETAKEADSLEINQESSKRWRTNRVQQIFASKLVEALRRVHQRSNDGGSVLATRVRASLEKHKKVKITGTRKPRKDTATERKHIKLPAAERKLKILGQLVLGCRKVTVPNLLDEATDYIAALEMQVRAMESLAELLAAAAPQSTLTRP